jgi:hypothetical protein
VYGERRQGRLIEPVAGSLLQIPGQLPEADKPAFVGAHRADGSYAARAGQKRIVQVLENQSSDGRDQVKRSCKNDLAIFPTDRSFITAGSQIVDMPPIIKNTQAPT